MINCKRINWLKVVIFKVCDWLGIEKFYLVLCLEKLDE